MKINWFSPIAPHKTAISQYTLEVTKYLSQKADVTVWTDLTKWNSEIEQYATVKTFQYQWKELTTSDLNFYNIGNNADYHGWIWQISQLHSGIVILHDLHLHHFFAGYYLKNLSNRIHYQNVLHKYYGAKANGIIDKLFDGLINIEYLNSQFPIAKYAIENAYGILVHAEETFNAIKQYQTIPVLKTNLPYESTQNTQTKIQGNDSDNFNIIIFGFIGENRCLEDSLRAIASIPSNNKLKLNIYGIVENEPYFVNLTKELDLSGKVFFHGFVNRDKLSRALNEADLAINLRFPSMGEGSYSQLQIWNHKLPSIVTRNGWYETLPSDVVYFVTPGKEVFEIKQHLLNFLSNRTQLIETGDAGFNYLRNNHDPITYVNKMLEFAAEIDLFKTKSVGISLTERIKHLMNPFNERLKNTVAEKIYNLFIS